MVTLLEGVVVEVEGWGEQVREKEVERGERKEV